MAGRRAVKQDELRHLSSKGLARGNNLETQSVPARPSSHPNYVSVFLRI